MRVNQTNCFEINWMYPAYANGQILFFEIHKSKKVVESEEPEQIEVINITSIANQVIQKIEVIKLKRHFFGIELTLVLHFFNVSHFLTHILNP